MKLRTAFLISVMSLPVFASEDDISATGVSGILCVDTRLQAPAKAVGSVDIAYNPAWATPTNVAPEGASSVLLAVSHAGLPNETTNVIAVCEANAAGVHSWTLPEGSPRSLRLLQRTVLGGKQVGDVLSRDVVFGWDSGYVGTFAADTRTNALQCVAEEGKVATLTFDPVWMDDAASVSVICEHDRLTRRGKSFGADTNVLASAASECGTVDFATDGRKDGFYLFRCIFNAASGEKLGEYAASFGFPFHTGLLMLIK